MGSLDISQAEVLPKSSKLEQGSLVSVYSLYTVLMSQCMYGIIKLAGNVDMP